MKKILTKKILIPSAILVVFLTTTAFNSNFFEIAKQIEIFTTMFKELNMNYVDDTNPGDLMDTAIKSMLDELDPYTRFYNEQDVQSARINNAGDYTGIGAKVRTMKDKLVIVEPYKDYAADKAGLKAGDEIIKIDGVDITDFKDDAGNLLQGTAGTEVNLTYSRQGKINTVKVTRESLEIDAVPHYSMINDNTGYIVLRKFNKKASSQTAKALNSLKNLGAKNIVLDLRGNPGGLLNEAVNIVNLFVPKDQLVVTTKSKVKKYNKTYYTKREPLDLEIPIVVLIDSKSASASEIVSGALQDLDRALVIGARSFGKGLVQRPKPLTYGTQMKITISRYYTPSGRCIQALDYWNRDENGNATRTEQKDYKAFKTKKGRSVFDGGGVQPDIEIAQTKQTPISKAIEEENLIFDFATDYFYKNTVSDLNNYEFSDSDFQSFKNYLKTKNFNFKTKTEKALNDALEVAKEENLDSAISSEYQKVFNALSDYKNSAISKNKEKLSSLLQDEIIKRYFYAEGLYDYYKANNKEIKEALEILNNPSKYNEILN
ncbi:carboxyl-terminal processing protease [Winogradskyella wandonensis]|uniref:Carboxyl-terminal processing protease n=1 Tax=Winogradskyella wandonensis TaxID=1442586 RepID=A0A4R1KS20_9FLAO|nr:S41 family peptidase [Winogradskyella wandonensis]TCK67856.1 carboxyl-terminal processing protease [Winogradskyella wandonensis]